MWDLNHLPCDQTREGGNALGGNAAGGGKREERFFHNGNNITAPIIFTHQFFPVENATGRYCLSQQTQVEVGVSRPIKKSRRGPRSRSSQYRGVTFYRRTGRWESHIWWVECFFFFNTNLTYKGKLFWCCDVIVQGFRQTGLFGYVIFTHLYWFYPINCLFWDRLVCDFTQVDLILLMQLLGEFFYFNLLSTVLGS